MKSTKIQTGKYKITNNGITLGYIINDPVRKLWTISKDEFGTNGAQESTKWQAMKHFK
jgi:hypothetical protein